jgi:hypothetical protein
MGQDEKNLDGEPLSKGSEKVKRTTIFLTEVLDENLEALSLTSGEAKGEIIRRALSEYLRNQGMQPHKKPKVSVSY